MNRGSFGKKLCGLLAGTVVLIGLAACAGNPELPTADFAAKTEAPLYRIGPLDSLEIFVWRNDDLSRSVTVRPDGRITVPLVEDLYVTDRTPTELAREIEKALAVYIQNPLVTVMVNGFNGPFDQQIRVLGEAQQPLAIPFQADMTLLDVMIRVGGVTEFADGDNATLVRLSDGEMREYRVRIDSLVRDGDISANIAMLPGDVLIIPESFF
ncbi:MAG: polysaccharide biosynthesis/export family protein [Proteobacteria bacterium]|nr:polysaccharide biosynthesis/export family protein [Pseudomonadota bacterium]